MGAVWTGIAALGATSAVAGVALAATPAMTQWINEPIAPAASLAAQESNDEPAAPAPAVTAEPEPTQTPVSTELPADMSPAYITSVYPAGGQVRYGVGIVLRITFGAPVPEELRELLERTAVIDANNPIGLAAWSWPDDYTMVYRPREFWPARTLIKFRTTWVENGLADYDPDRRIRIAREQILTIRQATQIGKLYRDGEMIREVPVSLGKPTWETASGIKTIMERYAMKRMVNPGPREPYDVQVPFALRITPSGEYLHAAPWNEYNLGVAPTSHGCTNMSYEDGQWFYENALEGDPVITKGTGYDVDWWEGPGAVWNIGWRGWKDGAAALP
ncbi:MAG: L,D-transpeptidase [Candidatus Nanopelagicales bacterium]